MSSKTPEGGRACSVLALPEGYDRVCVAGVRAGSLFLSAMRSQHMIGRLFKSFYDKLFCHVSLSFSFFKFNSLSSVSENKETLSSLQKLLQNVPTRRLRLHQRFFALRRPSRSASPLTDHSQGKTRVRAACVVAVAS